MGGPAEEYEDGLDVEEEYICEEKGPGVDAGSPVGIALAFCRRGSTRKSGKGDSRKMTPTRSAVEDAVGKRRMPAPGRRSGSFQGAMAI